MAQQRERWAALVAAAEGYRGATGAEIVLLTAFGGGPPFSYAHHGPGPLGAAARRYLGEIAAAHRALIGTTATPNQPHGTPTPRAPLHGAPP